MAGDKETPKYILIKEGIRDKIIRNEFEEKLPGERTLAKMFGYSYMTVRKAVDELVEEDLLYRMAARGTFVNKSGFSGKKTYNIGFFLDSSIKRGISSPYYSMLFRQIEILLKKEGYSLFFFTDLERLHPIKYGKKYDGLVLSCIPRIENRVKELAALAPSVIIDNDISDASLPYVGINNKQGVVEAVDYLAGIGHVRIAFVTGVLDSSVGYDRKQGYEDAIKANSLTLDPKLIYQGDYDFRSGQYACKKFLKLQNRPTAVVCANDSMAFGVIEEARRQGLTVPDDLSVIGFDDIEFASQSSPALTTVKVPIKQIAKSAIGLLLRNLKESVSERPEELLQVRLVVRNSCRPL